MATAWVSFCVDEQEIDQGREIDLPVSLDDLIKEGNEKTKEYLVKIGQEVWSQIELRLLKCINKKFDKWSAIESEEIQNKDEIKVHAKVVIDMPNSDGFDDSVDVSNISVDDVQNEPTAETMQWPDSCLNPDDIDLKYKKYVFLKPAYDVKNILPKSHGGAKLLNDFSADLDSDAKRKLRYRLMKICGCWLMNNCERNQFPSAMEKAQMAYSIYCCFPWWKSENPASKFPWQHIYDVFAWSGHLETYVAHKRSNDDTIKTQPYHFRSEAEKSRGKRSKTIQELVPLDEELAEFKRQKLVISGPDSRSQLGKSEVWAIMIELQQDRLYWISKESPTITDILVKYPPLLDYTQLILSDFHFLMKRQGQQTVNDFNHVWKDSVAPALVQTSVKNFSSMGIQSIFYDFGQDISTNGLGCLSELTEEQIAQLAILVLPYLLKPTNPKGSKAKRGSSRSSSAAALNLLIQFAKVGEEIETVISERMSAYPDLRQPWVLVFSRTGSYGDTPAEVHIVLDKRNVRVGHDFGSIIETLIACYYVFNAEYPNSLSHVYVFFELMMGLKPASRVGAQVNDLIGIVKAKNK